MVIHLQQQEIYDFLYQFFTVTGCNTSKNDTSIQTTLTIEMDKLLMNRPFYWHYLEKTGGTPNPSTLHLTIDKTHEDSELIHFGSPRLWQIFHVASELGTSIRLYQQIANSNQEIPLQPWVMLNGTIAYICDHKREVFYSYGINLLSGEIIDNFFHQISQFHLTPKIPDYCFTLSPLITLQSGMNRIQEKIRQDIKREEHPWAVNARKRWQHDVDLLENFYKDIENYPKNYYVEKEALQHQYEPHIKVSIINGGLIYLANKKEA